MPGAAMASSDSKRVKVMPGAATASSDSKRVSYLLYAIIQGNDPREQESFLTFFGFVSLNHIQKTRGFLQDSP